VDQISGTIQDSTGAATPQAKITDLQTSTGFSRSTASGSDGSYVLRSLPLGPYRIEISAAGDPNQINNRSLNKWFNTAAFSKNQPGTYGNAGRDSLEGPGAYHVDMALFRTFPFKAFEKPQSIQFRVEAFNALNHPTFNNPSSNLSSSNFGKILGAGDPRIMQVALKYVF